jgi:MinD-like ATPase involved in chromosome partitioning or flagellar assembly
MSIIALASAKGAPGVTTTTLAMAGVWSGRVVVAECDPFGGTIAARFGLPPSPGLLSLASQSRHQLRAESLLSHMQRLPPGGVPVLLGVQTFEQAMAVGQTWSLLPPALAGLGVDVLVDCGRLLPDAPSQAVLEAADLVLLVTRPTVEDIAHLERRLGVLEEDGRTAGVALVGEAPYDRRTVADRLTADGLRTPVLGVLADDPEAANMLCGRPSRRRAAARSQLARSYLVRSARELAETLTARLNTAPTGAHVVPSAPASSVEEVGRLGGD